MKKLLVLSIYRWETAKKEMHKNCRTIMATMALQHTVLRNIQLFEMWTRKPWSDSKFRYKHTTEEIPNFWKIYNWTDWFQTSEKHTTDQILSFWDTYNLLDSKPLRNMQLIRFQTFEKYATVFRDICCISFRFGKGLSTPICRNGCGFHLTMQRVTKRLQKMPKIT